MTELEMPTQSQAVEELVEFQQAGDADQVMEDE